VKRTSAADAIKCGDAWDSACWRAIAGWVTPSRPTILGSMRLREHLEAIVSEMEEAGAKR